MAADDIFVINAPPGIRERRRTSKSGVKQRFSVETTYEPIAHNLDALAVGKLAAEAVTKIYIKRLQGYARFVKAATLARRDRWAKEFQNSEYQAMRRFTGGRTGATPPITGQHFWLNHSGRLARMTTNANATDKSYTTNVPANRLNPAEFDKPSQLEIIFQRLVEALDPRTVLNHPDFKAAEKASIDTMITTLKGINDAKKAELRQALVRLFGAGLSLFGG